VSHRGSLIAAQLPATITIHAVSSSRGYIID
jgi:hypothetical protein